jgi:hypothetical protein
VNPLPTPKPYNFIEDPGHGWLKVPMAKLRELAVLPKISEYSYRSRDGEFAYLEEDCDMTRFVDALLDFPAELPIEERRQRYHDWFAREVATVHFDYDAPVRNLPRFPVRS